MTNKLIGIAGNESSLGFNRHRMPSIEKDDGKTRPDGATIRRMRKQRGYSRERLAELTGVAIKTLRNLETHPSYRCNPCTLGVLAQHYGVEPSALILPEDRPGMRLLTSATDILETKIRIVASAGSTLACIGSRSRHANLLSTIEEKLRSNPDLVHYRTMSLPPFKREFQEHLLKMVKIRSQSNAPAERKTLHIGIYDRLTRQSESDICANETMALVMLPCVSGVGSRSTAVLFEDAVIARRYIDLATDLYSLGRIIETRRDILSLGLVKEEQRIYS